MPVSKLVGTRVKRREDPRLVRGLSHYVDDIRLIDTLHVAIVRSPHAHAEIGAIRTERARSLSGVVAVVTGADIGDRVGSVPCAGSNPTLRVPDHPVLAQGRVRHVGEAVCAVVAEDAYTARDALDLIEVDYRPLPPVVDPEAALQPGAAVLHPQWPDNVAFTFELGRGDMNDARQAADKVIKQRIVNQRLAPISMEGRGVLAQYLPGEEELTIWTSTQIPHLARTQLALMLKVPEHRVRVIAPEVGGGFGCKLNVYAEEGLLGYLALELKRPVKWTEGRRENLQATTHGRDQLGTVEAAFKADGTILGLSYDIVADIGAYQQLLTPGLPPLTGLMICGCYKIPTVSFKATGVFTNKMSTDAYRGAGRPEALYVIERTVDLIARELEMDPAEVRRKNFPAAADFPFRTATGLTYDSGDYHAALDKALALADYPKLRERQRKLRTEGRYLGIGLSTYVEICAMGPSVAMPAGGWESGTVRFDFSGKATVLTGISPHGQGEETSFAQIVADELGVPMDDITVVHGDTARIPNGIGTFGSRGLAVGGTAVLMAAQQVKEKAQAIAAHILEASAEDVDFSDGRFTVKGVPGKGIAIQEVAQQAHIATKLPKGMEAGLQATSLFEPSNFTFPFGAHVCVVEVEPESGRVEVLDYVAVDDCGTVINPLLVEGQVHGGIAQGLGQALLEEVVYDENGQLVTGSLMDYALPRAENLPYLRVDRTETPTPVNPLGAKGVGEAGTIGSTPAVVNAVMDALAPFGVAHIDMPLKPERIWRACRGGGARSNN